MYKVAPFEQNIRSCALIKQAKKSFCFRMRAAFAEISLIYFKASCARSLEDFRFNRSESLSVGGGRNIKMFSSGSRRNYGIQTCSNGKKRKTYSQTAAMHLMIALMCFFSAFMSASFQSGPCADVSPAARCRICILSFDICL